jgi:hypothetical protein
MALSLLTALLDALVFLTNEISKEMPMLFITLWLRMAVELSLENAHQVV